MRVLIVGGAGDVGQYLTSDLLKRGHEVTVLDRAPNPPSETPSITYLQGSIADAGLVSRAVRGQDLILHLAWTFSDDPRTIFGEDIQGTIHLLEAAASSKVKKLIYTSTATVYGRALEHPVTERHPCHIAEARKPLYALGKYAAEELCLLYHKDRGIPFTIFRFWWAFGRTIGGRNLRELVKKALKGEPIEMVRGAGGTFVTMPDLAHAMALALEKPDSSGQIYNIGSLFLTWKEIGEMILALTNSKSPIQFIPSEDWKGPAFLNEIWDLSWAKSERELGYQPDQTVEQARSAFAEALKSCVGQVKGKEGMN